MNVFKFIDVYFGVVKCIVCSDVYDVVMFMMWLCSVLVFIIVYYVLVDFSDVYWIAVYFSIV